MSIARAPGLATRATTGFATQISARSSLNIPRWSRPLLNSRASSYISTPYLCRSLSTRWPSGQPSSSPSSPAIPPTLLSIQKCAFNTSTSTSPSLESTNRPDDSSTPTASSSSSNINSENPSTVYINPHRAKRIWPPDMSKLSPKQQFRLERKYRRRAKLKWARPTWTKWTKLVQWAIIGYVLVYCVMFMDLGEKVNPFQPIRDYVHQFLQGLLSTSSPPSFQKEPTTPTPKAAKSDS
ncbi:uncharacterized protein BDCG_08164 [Blastomyces dermatitidis ER-3]|uniref:Uncharacterized protein n=3 Tax=Blastomyces TaxID=229219 RepID=A0A179UK60_BLAGS|nr:uncharacterized protein BDBG_03474 [Blastomyces gilchristii SLH14081]XP_045272773.1 uncharacterized protein BDCG_08164 [Blastomyces dermatitidis ER-3]EEQ84895.1 hypothetical protein BDCG_08164 [Blastomyces dermatitidis ER-3]EGE79328.1 hypothetical protein BDDG_02267 [Blastomyces dermatitidis ATCC 18188]OAT07411.1 hypothetical protein BDBG_03474 [Blastomyces gilchristii SLH14081]